MKKGLRSVLFSVLVGALLLCAGCGKSGDIYTAGVYTADKPFACICESIDILP